MPWTLIDYRYQSVSAHCRVLFNLGHWTSICHGLSLRETPALNRGPAAFCLYTRDTARGTYLRLKLFAFILSWKLVPMLQALVSIQYWLFSRILHLHPKFKYSLSKIPLKVWVFWSCMPEKQYWTNYYHLYKIQLKMKIKYIWIFFVFRPFCHWMLSRPSCIHIGRMCVVHAFWFD